MRVRRYRPEAAPWSELNDAAATFFNIGNNTALHGDIFRDGQRPARRGGPARHRPAALLRRPRRPPRLAEEYLAAMRRHHGAEGLEQARRLLAGETGAGELAERFPLTLAAAERATALVCHTPDGARALEARTRVPVYQLDLSLDLSQVEEPPPAGASGTRSGGGGGAAAPHRGVRLPRLQPAPAEPAARPGGDARKGRLPPGRLRRGGRRGGNAAPGRLARHRAPGRDARLRPEGRTGPRHRAGAPRGEPPPPHHGRGVGQPAAHLGARPALPGHPHRLVRHPAGGHGVLRGPGGRGGGDQAAPGAPARPPRDLSKPPAGAPGASSRRGTRRSATRRACWRSPAKPPCSTGAGWRWTWRARAAGPWRPWSAWRDCSARRLASPGKSPSSRVRRAAIDDGGGSQAFSSQNPPACASTPAKYASPRIGRSNSRDSASPDTNMPGKTTASPPAPPSR